MVTSYKITNDVIMLLLFYIATKAFCTLCTIMLLLILFITLLRIFFISIVTVATVAAKCRFFYMIL